MNIYGVSWRITIVNCTLNAILWVLWKAKFMRLPTGDNYLFSFLSFPSSLLIKTLITLCMRIKFNPKEEKCIYAKVTPGKQWMELGCSWWQLCQVAVGKNPSLIIRAGYIILIFMQFLYRIERIVLVGDKSRCNVSWKKCLQRENIWK